jgi:hypothetical protein
MPASVTEPKKLGSTDYSTILATTPAPTVRPPSRIAKRRPSSMAIGLIRVTTIFTLSPGITISTPSGSSHATGYVGSTEVELRTVALEERSVATALLFGQNVNLGLELGVRLDGARLGQNLATLNVFTLGTAQQNAPIFLLVVYQL